jgi:nicotinamide mononucleotide adenylyltransferase
MIKFKSFLTEAEETVKPTKLGHLTHAHRSMFVFAKPRKDEQGNAVEPTDEEKSMGGHAGIATTDEMLKHIHDHLRGKGTPAGVTVSEKMEGAPSFLVRKRGGVTSVGYKGAAGKEDKLATSHEDIDRLYGHAPGLADKMHKLYDHAGKILPDSDKILQGDYLGDEDELQNEGAHHTTQPNSMKYHFGKDTPEGMKAKRAKVIFSLHTQYGPNGAEPIDKKTRASFMDHPDVYHMDPTANVNAQNYTPEEQSEFAMHMENARKAYGKIKDDNAYSEGNGFDDFMRRHGNDIESHINDSIRNNGTPSVEGYTDLLNRKAAKRIEGLKSQKGRDAASSAHADNVADVMGNQHHIKNALELMGHFQNAQEVLRKVAAKNSPYATSIDGQPTEGEGLVVAKKNKDGTTTMNKVANPTFTQRNLQGAGRISQAQKAPQQVQEETAPATTEGKAAWVMPGRFQPVHQGHVQGAMDSAASAKKAGASFHVLATHTHNRDNPLTPEQKIEHVRSSMPGIDVRQTSSDSPSILHHVSKLYREGVRNLTVVGGPEREQGHLDLLRKYAGVEGPHGFYGDDMKISSASTGARDPDAEGAVGASGTAMKKHAENNDFGKFSTMASPYQSTEQKRKMFDDIRSGQAKFPAKKTKALKEEMVPVPNQGNSPSVAELSAAGAAQESGPKRMKFKDFKKDKK